MEVIAADRMYRVLKESAIQATLVETPHGETHSAVLRALGCNEAIVLVQTELLFGEAICLNVRHEGAGLHLDLQASVGSCQREPMGEWSVECVFNTPIDLDLMEQLLATGSFDRRRQPRQPFHLPVLVQWEYDAASCPAFLWNISEGGFCLVCPRKPGRRLSVFTDRSGVRISARTRWQTKTGGGYVIGCEFANADSYERMLSWRPRPSVAREHGVERRQAVARAFRDLVGRVLNSDPAEDR